MEKTQMQMHGFLFKIGLSKIGYTQLVFIANKKND